MSHLIRPDLEALPGRLRQLPLDERGYPVPWFVDWLDGKPEFRAMDPRKFVRAIKEKLCWVCGQRLGVHLAFVAGPMCGVNRTSSEPPCHLECAQWSARNCPFLSKPDMVRREDGLMNKAALVEESAGFCITRNPGVVMVWITRQYEIFRPHAGNQAGYLLQMGDPERVEWWCQGRTATRAEVDASIESGLPNLETMARLEPGGMRALERAVRRFERWLP
ncbi:MAG TPA: hypothetical protein VIY07_09545 [Pseudolabrys sp.]